MTEPYQEKKIWQYALATGKIEAASKPIVSEHAAALSVNGQHWLTFICSPPTSKRWRSAFFTVKMLSKTWRKSVPSIWKTAENK